ncbi:hypothetical protein ACS229_31080, partial [Klebsiella pneumoniae]|uniref:hypothetical protein n=1 Tax=Klebsiella pneumoniae TaxID=573 RepID=UPI003F2285C2
QFERPLTVLGKIVFGSLATLLVGSLVVSARYFVYYQVGYGVPVAEISVMDAARELGIPEGGVYLIPVDLPTNVSSNES